MTRLLAAVLVLCTQVLAVFGTGNFIVCVQQNGDCAIELAGSECCRAAHEAEQRRPDREDGTEHLLTAPLADRCSDVPYEQDQTLVARGSQLRSDLHHVVRTVAPAVVALTGPAKFDFSRTPSPDVRGPPRDPVPRRARTFILRC